MGVGLLSVAGASAQEDRESPAVAADQGGKATIRCVVAKDARLDACTVLSETPAGAGFGEMALRMSKEMRFRGPGTVGGAVEIPITFKPNAKASPKR
jgi:TonB family protein